ncbi:MAG: Fic family protein [Prevotella sp.]|jgi:Fic family protein|nr:Fic family protein [Prevotella sp.]MBQ5495809.1 Fic family protein [Prevotella sp.]
MFDNEIEEYEAVRKDYQREIADKMGRQQWMEYNEILFSAHSCAIEGNSFTVDDTRILREQGMAMVPVGRSLLECTEMADHFRAFDYLVSRLDGPFDESLLKEINRLVTEHTLSYRAQGAVAGEYTTEDMAAGDTVFGDHETLIAQVPHLMESTQKALDAGLHPMVVAAKWHGYYEYLHPFRDGNGRTGRLLSNFILLRAEHPLLIIRLEDRSAYISALKQIRSEGTDEHLVAFFFKTAITRMKEEMAQKRKLSKPFLFF